MGVTPEARFAGDPAANRTVTTPTKTPLPIPAALMPKSGIWENSSPTKKRRAAHRPQEAITPRVRPTGMAVLHQFRASSRTKRTICCLLIPRQRIIPKNCVLCATLLFKLLEIISAPAIRTSRKRAAAVRRRVCPRALSIRLWREKPPCFSANRICSILAPISAMLKMAVTRNTAKMMHRSVMRFWRRCTFAEIGIRLK